MLRTKGEISMARKSMKEIRALAKKKVEGGGNNNNKTYNKDIYPFWQMKENESAKVRFLPDKNKDNDFPFIERLDHWLTIDGKNRKIVCPKTEAFGGTKCPICELSADYYDADDKVSGKAYYRSAVHLAKALVLEDPLPPDPETGETYVGKVVTLQLGYQLYTKFMEDLGNIFEDDDPLPWELDNGFNFNLKKTKNAKGHPKWDSSSYFDRNASAIPDEYLENIELIDLKEILGDVTTYDEVNLLLEQHLNGSTDDGDSLETKRTTKASSEKTSKRAAMLKRLSGDDDDDDDSLEDVPNFDDDSPTGSTVVEASEEAIDDDDDDDDDDDLGDLKKLIKKRRKS